jgi:Domain of unknown function (DUF5671)
VQPNAGPLPALQRAYLYLVALVAIFMVVIGVANLLRVGAELAASATPGSFTGLWFLFWDYNRLASIPREQASLALALVAVGTPVWFFHFRAAQRAANDAVAERASAMRSFYIHAVVLVTALLVFGYGQRALGLLLQGAFIGSPSRFAPGAFGLEAQWLGRAAGAGAMAVTAIPVLSYHLWLSSGDRRIALFSGRAAQLRHLALYGLVLAALAWGSYIAISTLGEIWTYASDQIFNPPTSSGSVAGFPPGFPSREDYLAFRLLGMIPGIVASVALWLGVWIPLQRGIRGATPSAEIERRSSIRKLAVYLIVLFSALAVLLDGTIALTAIGRRLLGDPVVERFTTLYREVGTPIVAVVILGAVWIFYGRVVAFDAALETEAGRAATIRRLYTYLIAAIGMGMLGVGLAGMVGVIGSQAMHINTHPNSETATYISIVLLGAPAWAVSWWQARRRLDDDERRSAPRRGYLYLAILAGVLGSLVFGSALLYRLLNAAFAGSFFSVATWHDVWHFLVDAAVSASVFLFHYRALRADRSAQLPAVSPHSVTVVVRASDATAARARLAAVLEGQPDITVR